MNENEQRDLKKRAWVAMLLIAALLISTVHFFIKSQEYRSSILYNYEVVPHISLTNTVQKISDVCVGEIRGFVKFDDSKKQPIGAYQYYIIKPLYKPDDGGRQFFLVEEVIKLSTIPPTSLGVAEVREVSDAGGVVTLIDDNKNQYFIDYARGQVSLRDSGGDLATLITSNSEYRDFVISRSKR